MAIANEPGVTSITTPTDREVLITRVVDAPRRLVWQAYVNPEHVPHWMKPKGWTMPVCEIDLGPGGGWRYGWRRTDGTQLEMRGAYQEVTPQERLVWTESWGADWPETLNTLRLQEHDGRTTIAMTIRYPSRDARDTAMRTGMSDGANESFEQLDEHLRAMA